MAKQKRGSKSNSNSRSDSTSPNRPRLDPQIRLLSRFYEPLVLLYTLGNTRGERACAEKLPQDHLAYLPLTDLRRTFLTDLAYMCDYDKGGETVTAIGVQSTPQKHIFWVASNAGLNTKIINFLRSLLTQVMRVSAAAALDIANLTEELALLCIDFATPRVKKYRSLLKPVLRRCISYLIETQKTIEPGLVEWLQSWDDDRSPSDLCRSAYASRKSDFMRVLARLGAEPNYKSNRDAIHLAFGKIRHYIGRLGYHFRAAATLVSCAPRLMDLLDDFDVCSVPVPAKSVMSPPDQLTNLDKILGRMLPTNSPELEHYRQALTHMDTRYQLSQRFLENYAKPDRNACVHAEVQVLEQFYAYKMQYSGDDPYIACSKPACFCCLLYFRHHPGHVVEPVSHNKIYLNWRPPDFGEPIGIIGPHHERDILNAMNQEIRKEVLHQLQGKTAPMTWHPDSVTGITQSAQSEHAGQPDNWVDLALSEAAVGSVPFGFRSPPPASGAAGASFQDMVHEEGDFQLLRGTINDDVIKNTPQSLESILEDFVSDSDQGISKNSYPEGAKEAHDNAKRARKPKTDCGGPFESFSSVDVVVITRKTE
ncbi:hypothetical protein J1614_001773 [Plenodomus biglobosus]|nr:hypothetical protein J1614_001773 [Plenodomus biglobosus]